MGLRIKSPMYTHFGQAYEKVSVVFLFFRMHVVKIFPISAQAFWFTEHHIRIFFHIRALEVEIRRQYYIAWVLPY